MAVQTISYTNKVDLNTTSVANINKVNASDLNEIKTVVNNNATALEKTQGTILWTNPSPTSSFGAQTITLSSSDYDVLEIYCAMQAGNPNDIVSGRTIKGKNVIINCLAPTASASPMRVRRANYVSDTSLSVESAYYGTTELTTTNNTYVIPLYVVGYKTGVF